MQSDGSLNAPLVRNCPKISLSKSDSDVAPLSWPITKINNKLIHSSTYEKCLDVKVTKKKNKTKQNKKSTLMNTGLYALDNRNLIVFKKTIIFVIFTKFHDFSNLGKQKQTSIT